MKSTRKITLQICCLLLSSLLSVTAYCQNKDSLLQVYPSAKNEAERFSLIYNILNNPDPKKGLYYHQKLLALTQKQGDKAGEAWVTELIGFAEYLAGNTAAATDIGFKALRMAEEAKSEQAVGWAYYFLGLCLQTDPQKAKEYFDKSLAASIAVNDNQMRGYALATIANFYNARGKTDTALYLAQQILEVFAKHKYMEGIPGALVRVGNYNYKLGRKGLALEYYRAALQEPYIMQGDSKENADDKAGVYQALSRFYLQEGKLDSALHYAKIAYQAVQNISFGYHIQPTFLLWKAYEKTNSDSALKYATLYYSAKDSVYSAAKLQQIQTMALLEEERQQKLKEERQNNLQYAAIALGVVTLLIGFLVFSYTVLASQKLIRFLGVVSLLIVFEFLNLLLHPMLATFTHHSPVLMLLIMVCIAAMLVPLHHRVEHWTIHKLVEKNNKIRLAAAKKTIEKLEGKVSALHVETSTDTQQGV
jgi:tetratricopeptide (TPR) repeat protein